MNLSRGKYIFNEFFIYFYNMDFKMDIFSFLRRKNIKQADLSRLLKTVPGNVTRWVKEEGVPSYELCGKLLSLGMTVEELWGIEYKGGGPKLPDNPELRAGQQPRKPIDHNDPEWQKLVKNALAEMKQNGQL